MIRVYILVSSNIKALICWRGKITKVVDYCNGVVRCRKPTQHMHPVQAPSSSTAWNTFLSKLAPFKTMTCATGEAGGGGGGRRDISIYTWVNGWFARAVETGQPTAKEETISNAPFQYLNMDQICFKGINPLKKCAHKGWPFFQW